MNLLRRIWNWTPTQEKEPARALPEPPRLDPIKILRKIRWDLNPDSPEYNFLVNATLYLRDLSEPSLENEFRRSIGRDDAPEDPAA